MAKATSFILGATSPIGRRCWEKKHRVYFEKIYSIYILLVKNSIMMMPLKLVLLTILIVISKACFSQTVDTALKLPPNVHFAVSDSEHIYYFKDEDVFKLPDGEAKVWTSTITHSIKIKNKTYHDVKTKALMMVDCSQYKMKTVELIYYSSPNDILEDNRNEFNTYKDVVPGSVGYQITDEVCKIINK